MKGDERGNTFVGAAHQGPCQHSNMEINQGEAKHYMPHRLASRDYYFYI